MYVASIRSKRNGIDPELNVSRDDLEVGDLVTVESENIGTAYAWSLAYVPDGSTAALTPPGAVITKGPLSFQVDKAGPYLVRLQYSTPKVDIAAPVAVGESLTINGLALNAVAVVVGINEFAVTGSTTTDASAIASAINDVANGWASSITAYNVPGSSQVLMTPDVDGFAIVIQSTTSNMVVGTATTEQFVRLRALTAFGALHLVAAGEQYGGSNPPIPADIDPVGWTNEQNNNLLSLLSLVETVSASGNILYVDPISGDFHTIQAAIDDAVSKGPSVQSQWLVAVRPGVYQEQLTFAPFVHVVGWPGVTEFTSIYAGAEVVKVQQTAAMGAHSIALPVANECLLIAGIHFERPGAGASDVIQEQAGSRGLTHLHHCRLTSSGTGACYHSGGTTGAPTILEDCYLAADLGWAVAIGENSYTQLFRCRLGGQSGIQLVHNSTGYLRDCWVDPTGATAVDIQFSAVGSPGSTFEAVYTRFKGECTVNNSQDGCNTGVEFRGYWCDFQNPGDISMDGTNVAAAANIRLGASQHGTIEAINGALYVASVPADTIFYDHALVNHSRIIGVTEVAGDLTAENVQDAIDEVYSYAIEARTLDDAYDAGMVGGGLGRDIVADSEAVRILDGNPPGTDTPITSTDGQLQVVSKIEIGGIGKAEIKLDPNPFGGGAEITLGEAVWVGNAPYGSPTFIWGNSTSTATYHNYDLFLSAQPTDGGGQVGSIIMRGGAGLNSGKGHDPTGGDVHLVGGDALGENLPASGTGAPDGGTVYIAPGGLRYPATAGSVGTILLGRPEDATRAVLNAPAAYTVPLANGIATFGTDLGAFTIDLVAGSLIADAISKLNQSQYVIADESPVGFIRIQSATKGPLAQVFYITGDPAIQTNLGNFQATTQTNGDWPSHMEVVVSAANEISFGPNAPAGPLVYNANSGKLTVPGVIDPTGMIYTESTLANLTLAANGWTATDIGGLFVADGTAGLDDNHLYYVFEDGTPLKLSGGGTGDVVGPASSTHNAVVRFDGATGKILKDSNALLADNGDLGLVGSLTVDIVVAGTDAFVLLNRFTNAASSAIIHTTGGVPDWTTGTQTVSSDYAIADGGGNERFKVAATGAVTINTAYTLPVTDGVASGDVLTTDGAGTVTWATSSGALPAPTAEGEILYAVTAAAFVRATPLVNSSGFILVNSSGNMVVV
tara:strand:+ start:658 stop:4203 length:3546 start_codon:yes stop_codon:yes gene_type:complete